MTSQFKPTATNMVNQVRSIIEGYGMGAIRALAQEPVQNAKDEKKGKTVRVEYRLHRREDPEGRKHYLLTITDNGTGGLKELVLDQEQLQQRGYTLQDGENWAAFEGQGFTEKSGGDLGCRGQVKSAALYHSNPGEFMDDGRDRLLMIYDTFLEDAEYRMGVRYADPSDTILSPPLYDDTAKLTVMDDYKVENGPLVSIGLEPLEQTGTRIIIPFVREDTIDAIHSGELHRWLQRCWWRAIQICELEITVVDEDGDVQAIGVPSWWAGQPWTKGAAVAKEYKDIPVDDGLPIKRIVLSYDPGLKADEIPGYGTQYGGVQLLRGRQWIETQDIRDHVPPEHRAGFRAFAEFDQKLEEKLKFSEKPQHESFDGRFHYVSTIRQKINEAVRDFAEEQGWAKPMQTEAISRRDQEHAADFLAAFTTVKHKKTNRNGKGKDDSTEPTQDWKCQLDLDFPNPETSRVDWGDSITGVTVTAEVKLAPENRWATVSLEVTRKGDEMPKVIKTAQVEFLGETQQAHFGDFQIIKGQAHTGRISCPEPGQYTLRASVIHAGQRVATHSRRIHVEVEPSAPPEARPYTVSISAANLSNPGEKRINSGDELFVQVTITNRTPSDVTLEVDASLEDLLICDGTTVDVPGTPAGDTPSMKVAGSQPIFLFTDIPGDPPEPALELAPGRHLIRADLRIRGDYEVQAHASYTIFFEADPGGTYPDLPFELEAIEDEGNHPMWDLQDRPNGRQVLMFPARYPINRELPESKNGSRASGKKAFLNEICAHGVLEWALDPLKNCDGSNMDTLKKSAASAGDSLRDQYHEDLERLEEGYRTQRIEEPRQYDLLRRQTVANMLRMYQESN